VRLAREAKPLWGAGSFDVTGRDVSGTRRDLADRWSYGRHSSGRDSGL